ncbi:MAG: helix-turn-helix transcriptional regulator [Clostridia bacterium]|nr:helix-turn-helix transcriptional regulator [Clostridia bacterium]
MNPDYISYLFHKESGQALTTYISNARIDLAKKLLASSQITIQEISDQCGFSSTSYFHKQFKRVTGMTPQQYKAVHFPA